MQEHHYLGCVPKISETLWYIALCRNQWVALVGFSAAAWKCAARDISSIEKNYSYFGQNAYDPRLIVGILIYAYSKGVFSSRQIEKRCHEDLSFMYISHRNCPNFRVLSDFRKDNPEFLKDCFIQSALLAKELGMVSFGHVSLDGSKFKANS